MTGWVYGVGAEYTPPTSAMGTLGPLKQPSSIEVSGTFITNIHLHHFSLL